MTDCTTTRAAARLALAAALAMGASRAHAQPPVQTHDSIVKAAVERFARESGSTTPENAPVAVQTSGGLREIKLADAVELALRQNLDIAVERLNPDAVGFLLAGLKNSYHPIAVSTVGQRGQVNAPTNQLNGGQRVTNDTTTYNVGLNQVMPWGGGNFNVSFNNSRLATSNLFANYNPTFTSTATLAFNQPLLRSFRIDSLRQQIAITQVNREISEEQLRAVIASTVASVRNAYWDLAFARAAVDVAKRSLDLAERLVQDNQARVEVGTLAPLDIVQAEAEAANRRQTLALAEATLATAQLTFKRLIVTGTTDPMWDQDISATDLPQIDVPSLDVGAAVSTALARRTDLAVARRNLESNEITLRYWRSESLPDLGLQLSYGAQGIGGPQLIRNGTGIGSQITGSIPGGYNDALSILGQRDFPTWNAAVIVSYPLGGTNADAQHARARVQRTQQSTRLRALELQVATEVTNAALQVQANTRRVDAARAARALAERRLEAEQSKFEVGLSTNFFVVQAQRDLADAQNAELRSLTDLQKALVTFERSQESPANGGGSGSAGGAVATNANQGGGA